MWCPSTHRSRKLGGVGNLDQHRSHAGSLTLVCFRSLNMKVPDGRNSFTSQHTDGELLSKDLAGHAVRPRKGFVDLGAYMRATLQRPSTLSLISSASKPCCEVGEPVW